MANWDVFHGDRLEVERSLSSDQVRQALARGEIRDDDLVRPAGTSVPWAPLSDFPALLEPEPAPPPPPTPPAPPLPAPAEFAPEIWPAEFEAEADDDEEVFDSDALDVLEDDQEASDDSLFDMEIDDEVDEAQPAAAVESVELGRDDLDEQDVLDGHDDSSLMALPAYEEIEDEEEFDPQDEDEAAAEFTLSRGGPERVEELDLAAMVDVAFQLVLFFLVTATTVLYKSLEVPKPNPEAPANVTQGRRTMEDLKNDFILVEIDSAGVMKIDREPVAAEMPALIERLRTAREKTGRKAMLLTADFATPHRSAVLAYDAANEIGLGIAIARPTGKAPDTPKGAGG